MTGFKNPAYEAQVQILKDKSPIVGKKSLNDEQARMLGDLMREFPDRIGETINLAGKSIEHSSTYHRALLWTCLIEYAPEEHNARWAKQYLRAVNLVKPGKKLLEGALIKNLMLGIGSINKQLLFFEKSWPLLLEHWKQKDRDINDLAYEVANILILPSVREPKRSSLLNTILDARSDLGESILLDLLQRWCEATAMQVNPTESSGKATLDVLIQRMPKDKQQQGLDDTVIMAGRHLEKILGPGTLNTINYKRLLDCLIQGGADWTILKNYPKTMALIASHPAVVREELSEIAKNHQVPREVVVAARPKF